MRLPFAHVTSDEVNSQFPDSHLQRCDGNGLLTLPVFPASPRGADTPAPRGRLSLAQTCGFQTKRAVCAQDGCGCHQVISFPKRDENYARSLWRLAHSCR